MTEEERKQAFAKKIEEEKRKKAKPEESVWTKAAKSGWLGTRAKITAEAEEERQGK